MKIEDVILKIESDDMKDSFLALYGKDAYNRQKKRYLSLINKFQSTFKQSDIRIISSPGRTELGGNHTDHNHGRVLAASIQLDSIAIITENSDNVVTVYSEGFPQAFTVHLNALDKPI